MILQLIINKTNNDIMQKENKINQNISKDTSISNGSGSGSNCNVYIRHTVQKKISKQNIVTKDNKDNDKNTDIKLNKKSKINIIKRNNINDNDIIDNYPYEKIKEKPKIVINKKIVIKCNDINDLKESFDLVKSNDNYINNILKIQPFTAPEILKKRMDELNLEKETKKNEDQKDISNSKICKQLKIN